MSTKSGPGPRGTVGFTLAMLACAFLAATRAREADLGKPEIIPLICNEIRPLIAP